MPKKERSYFRSGVALVVVMLIILGATAIALVSMQLVSNESRMSSAFTYNRQAARAAHAITIRLQDHAGKNAMEQCSKQTNAAVSTSIQLGEFRSAAETSAGDSDSSEIGADALEAFSGLSANKIDTENAKKRLQGDLARPTYLVATTGNYTLSPTQVAGFSNGDAFSRYNMRANSYALIGRPAMLKENGGQKYYLLSEVNGHVSGFKREFGIYEIQPLACK